MGAVVRNVSVSGSNPTVIPTRENGSFYTFEMVTNGGWSRCYDDSPENLLEFLIPGYTVLLGRERLQARIQHAVKQQSRLQTRLNSVFSTEPRSPREQKILAGARYRQPMITEWECATPLVLIDAFYYPYTETFSPVSVPPDSAVPNLWWLRPAQSDLEYLKSLHETSIIDLHVTSSEALL